MRIVKYLYEDVFSTVVSVTVVLLLIFLSQHLVRYLNYAATGKMAVQFVLQLMALEIPYLMALVLPLGLFLGVVLVFGRLYVNYELIILHACGVSLGRLLYYLSGLILLVTGTVAFLMLWFNPQMIAQKNHLLSSDKAQDNFIETLAPGRFQELKKGSYVLYVEKLSRSHQQASHIFMAYQPETPKKETMNHEWVVVSAEKGFQKTDPVSQDRFVILTDGYRYQGTPGHADYNIIRFGEYGVRRMQLGEFHLSTEIDAQKTSVLWQKRHHPSSAAELEWRISLPLTVPILACLAVGLSRIKPRYGRYTQLLPAMFIYVIYAYLLLASRHWIEQGVLWPAIGMWWVHGLFFIVAYWFLFWKKIT